MLRADLGSPAELPVVICTRELNIKVEDSVDVEEGGFLVRYGPCKRKVTIANHYALMLNADRVDVVMRNA
jgi:hypothetical protein